MSQDGHVGDLPSRRSRFFLGFFFAARMAILLKAKRSMCLWRWESWDQSIRLDVTEGKERVT